MKRAFKYRIYPARELGENLNKQIEEASIEAYKEEKEGMLGYDLNELALEIKKEKNFTHISAQAVGIDVGLASIIATSNGELIENPKILKESEKLLKIRNRQLSKKKKGSKNRNKAKIKLAKAYMEKPIASIAAETGKLESDLYFRSY